MDGHGRPRQTVALLEVDPDLGAGLDAEAEELARRHAVAAVFEVGTVDWDPGTFRDAATDGWLGLFLIDGLMVRRVQVGKRTVCELFGPGDVVRPWDADADYDPLTVTITWMVLEPTRIAMLDTAFALRIARWPTITSRIVGRLAQRARCLALAQAVTHLRRVHSRLLILFWLLAERWGKVGPRGVHVDLPLTHEVLAMLVGTHRPTATLALQRLAAGGLLIRERPDRWLLTSRGIEMLRRPEAIDPGVNGDRDDELDAEAGELAGRLA